MMRDDTFHQCPSHGLRAIWAEPAKDRPKAAGLRHSGLGEGSVFPHRYLWQPSHGYIARLHGIIAHWLQPTAPNPNGFGGRA